MFGYVLAAGWKQIGINFWLIIRDVIVWQKCYRIWEPFFEFVIFTFISGEEPEEMSPDEVATRAKMKEAGYSEEEIQTMIDAGCTEMAD